MDFTLRIDPNAPWLKRKTKRLIENFEAGSQLALANGAGYSRSQVEPGLAEVAECVALFVACVWLSKRAALGAPPDRSAQAKAGEPVKVDAASQADNPLPPGYGDSQRAFARWARNYDDSLNPMLSLEERILPEILPDMRGRDVVDVGCGTGRWLERIAAESPASLVGIDSSAEMLERAHRKLGARAMLEQGDAMSLPVASGSADVILASFVASYIPDLPAFAAELRRIARKGAQVFFSDLILKLRRHAIGSGRSAPTARTWRCYLRAFGAEATLDLRSRGLRGGLSVGAAVRADENWRSSGRLEGCQLFYSAAGLPAILCTAARRGRSRWLG